MEAKIKCSAGDRVPLAAFTSCPTPTTLDGLSFMHCRDTKNGMSCLEGITKQNSKIQYSSPSIRTDQDPKVGYRYMIGVIPAGSSTMSLHPTSSFSVTSQVKGIYKNLAEIEKTKDTYSDKRNSLINTFGAGKKKRELASFLAGRVQDDRMIDLGDVKQQISGKADDLGMKKDGGTVEAAEEDKMRELLPKFNLKETVPALIYDKKTIVPEYCMAGIEGSWYSQMISDGKKFVREQSQIPFKCLREIVEQLGNCPSSTATDHRRQGKSVMVLHWFIELYRFSFCKPGEDQNGRKKPSGSKGVSNTDFLLRAFEKTYGPPREIVEYWLNTFQEPGESKMMNRKKILAYFCVWLILLAPEHKWDFQSVLEDLDDTKDKYISRVVQYIGCEKRMAGSWVLRAPLQVPEVRGNKKRRKF